jgi:hypothetical protein
MRMTGVQPDPAPVGIVAAAYYLPGEQRNIADWGAEEDISPTLIDKLLANGCRYFYASDTESDQDLVLAALERLAAQVGRHAVASASYLVHAHTQNFSLPPAPASLLAGAAGHYGIQPKLCFSVEQMACCGIVAAVDWAARLLAGDPDAEHALVISSDRSFGNASYRIYQQGGIQSDGASAILLGKSAILCGIGPATYRHSPELHHGPSTPANEAAIGRYTWLHTRQLFQDHAGATGMPVADHGLVMPINAYRDQWRHIAQSLGFPPERLFLDNIGERGHACCSDLAINLVDRGLDVLRHNRPVLYCGRSNVGAYSALTLLPPVMVAQQAAARRERVACEVTP